MGRDAAAEVRRAAAALGDGAGSRAARPGLLRRRAGPLRALLRAPFFGDDLFFIPGNPYLHALSGENLAAYLDPLSELNRATANYAPLHLVLHALEWPG